MQVILGGGRAYMFHNTTGDPEYKGRKGERRDGKNLVNEWLSNKKVNSTFIKCAHQFYVWMFVMVFINKLFFSNFIYMFVFVPHLQNAQYVWNKSQFDAVNPETTDFLMGKKTCVVHQLQLHHIEKKF